MDIPTSPMSPASAPSSQFHQTPAPMHHGIPKVVIALVAIVVLVGGYVALAKSQSLWPFAASTSTVSPTASVAPDATASWKTYTSPRYGFTMKYPASWSVTTTTNGETLFVSPETKAATEKNTTDCTDGNDATPCNPENINVDVVFSPTAFEATPGTEKPATFNGISFTEYEAVSLFGEKHYRTIHGGMTYDFSAVSHDAIFMQMMGTLVFTK